MGLTLLGVLADKSREPMPLSPPITVALARFDDLLGRGLRQLIESDSGLEVVAAEVDHDRIPVVLQGHAPDIAILDASTLSRLDEVRELASAHPATKLILLANSPSMTECTQLLAFGASACLGKDTQSRDVLNAIYLASRDLRVFPRAASALSGHAMTGHELLTQREAEVLPLLQMGRSNAQIALALQVGVETVRSHARSIYRKLGVTSRRELAEPPRRVPGPEIGMSGLPKQNGHTSLIAGSWPVGA
jgi:DNA-binding NarL/FixJ family response regulator